jgi:hypothetical protein
MLQFEDPPSYLVVHVGGNDIGKEKNGYLRNNLKLFLRKFQRKLPNTIIVWWRILSTGSLSSFGEGVFHNGGLTDPYTYK